MELDREVWKTWAQALQRQGAGDWAAGLLEAAGPLTGLGAQLVYIGRPLAGGLIPDRHMEALARLLEEPALARSFAAYLREEQTS
jgi:hypothetical protein